MLILVSGGSASGKSEFAEGLVTASGLETRAYLATMPVWGTTTRCGTPRARAGWSGPAGCGRARGLPPWSAR